MNHKLVIGLLATTINQKYRDQIVACRETWIPEAEKHQVPVVIFGGYHVDPQVPVVNLPHTAEDYYSAFNKQFLGLKYLYDKYDADFYFFAGTDNYIFTHRLLKLIENYNSSELLYVGGHGDDRNINGTIIHFYSGGGGFLLSRGALAILNDHDLLSLKATEVWRAACADQSLYPACDVAIAYLAHIYNFTFINDSNFKGCNCYGLGGGGDKCCGTPDWSKIYTCHYMEPHVLRYFHRQNSPWEAVVDDEIWLVSKMNQINTFLLKLQCRKIIFCDPDLASQLEDYQSPYTIIQIDPSNNKYELIAKAVADGRPKWLVWLDSDISEECSTDYQAVYDILKLKRDKISFPYTGQNNNIKLLSGSVSSFQEIASVTSDEQLINLRDICQVYYSDAKSILANYSHIYCGAVHIIKNIINPARAKCHYQLTYDAASQVIYALKNNLTETKLEHKVMLAEDLYIAAFYLNKNDMCLLALQYLNQLFEQDSTLFNLRAQHYISNTNYFWSRLPDKNFVVIDYNDDISNLKLEVSPGYKIVVYADVPLTYKSFCFRDVIVLPRNLKDSLPGMNVIATISQ